MILLLLLAACGSDDPCAGRRDLALSPAGLDLTAAEHPSGWGHAECVLCHPIWEVHAEDCIDGVEVDPEAIEAQAAEGCTSCHGDNGVDGADTTTTEGR